MERVPFHDREMEISIQYHVMLIRQSSDQILMRCYIKRDGRGAGFQDSSKFSLGLMSRLMLGLGLGLR